MAKHWQETMFPSLPRAVDLVHLKLVHLKCILSSCILVHLKLLSRLRSEFSDLVMGKHSKHSKESNEKRCVLFLSILFYFIYIYSVPSQPDTDPFIHLH
jgi:hypothetical protein